MASFTDAISTFNPYISQLPIVEEMSKVGMERQAKYDQGVQKIQGQIDNVAGMDIIKDVDKANLQSKLNQLGSDLRAVAASDFSNFQLVNSVGGMATQIIKDPTIRNAVSSTANYRKQLQNIEAARKAGKSDKNNEEYFQKDADKWLTSSKVGEVFSESFVEYTDIMKKVRESIKDAGLNFAYIEQQFETDSRGIPLLDKNNQLIPSKYLTTEEIETNAPQVKAIVENLLNQGDVQKQIRIDGWANTRFTPVESVYRTFESDFNVRDAEGTRRLLELQAFVDANNLTAEEKQTIRKEQNSIKETLRGNNIKLEELKKQAIESPEQFKQNYYEDNYKNNLLNLATNKHKKEVKASPLTAQNNWEENMTFLRDKETFDRIMSRALDKREETKLSIELEKLNADYPMGPDGVRVKVDTTAAGKKKGAVGATTVSEINSENPGSDIDAQVNYQNGTLELQKQAQLQGFQLIHTYLDKLSGGVDSTGNPYSENNTRRTIQDGAKANGETEYGFITRFAADIKNKADKNQVSLSASDDAAIKSINKLNGDILNRTAVTEDIYKQVKNETGIDPRTYSKIFSPIPITTGSGSEVMVTPQDQVDLVLAENRGFSATPEQESAAKRLKDKFGSITNLQSALYTMNNDYQNTINKLGSNKDFGKVQKLLAEKFKKVNIVSDNFSSSVGGTKEEREAAVSAILPLFNVKRLSEADQTAFIAALEDSKLPITYDARRPISEGQEWTGTAFISVGGVKHGVELNQKNLEIVANRKFDPYVEDGLGARARSSKYRSTNLGTYVTDPNAYQTAAIGTDRFTSLKGTDYTAKADIEPLPGGELILQIYAKDRTMKDYLRIEFPVTKLTPTGNIPFTDYNEIAREVPNITPGMIKIKLDALKKSK